MADPFETQATGLDSPARNGAAVTPNDSTDLTTSARALYIGGAGDVVVQFTGDPSTSVTLTGLSAGVIYPLCVSRVLSTGTTATNIVALW